MPERPLRHARTCSTGVRFIFVDGLRGVDSTVVQAFTDIPDTKEAQCHAPPQQRFPRPVEARSADCVRSSGCRPRRGPRVRRLRSRDRLIALLYGQLSGANSLREIVGGLHSRKTRLYHVGARAAQRSTLADANANRPAALLAALFAETVGDARRGLRRKIGEATCPIDATGVRLGGRGSQWAHFPARACGARVHAIYDADAGQPLYASVTAAKVNDITAAQAMPVEAGATSVFRLRPRLLRFRPVGRAGRRRLAHRHPVQDQYAIDGEHRARPARRRQHSLGPHRPVGATPGPEPQEPVLRAGARGPGQDRHRRGGSERSRTSTRQSGLNRLRPMAKPDATPLFVAPDARKNDPGPHAARLRPRKVPDRPRIRADRDRDNAV